MLLTLPIIALKSLWLIILGLSGQDSNTIVLHSFRIFLVFSVASTSYGMCLSDQDFHIFLSLILVQLAALFLLGRKYPEKTLTKETIESSTAANTFPNSP